MKKEVKKIMTILIVIIAAFALAKATIILGAPEKVIEPILFGFIGSFTALYWKNN